MRKRTLTAALATAIVLSLAACGPSSSGITSTPEKSAAGSSSKGKSDKSAKAAVAKVGSAIKLDGQSDGEQATVTLVKVVDPAKPTDEFSRPDKGNRFVAVQFVVANTGSEVYEDSPSNGAVVVDSEGQSYDTTLFGTKAGPELRAGLKLAPGAKAKGFLTFEVPKPAKITKVQFSMVSGFGTTGEWSVR